MLSVGDIVQLIKRDGPCEPGIDGIIEPRTKQQDYYEAGVVMVRWAGENRLSPHYQSWLIKVDIGPIEIEDWRL